MIALKLSSKTAAKRFIEQFNQKKFNQIEEEVCNVYCLDSAHVFNDNENLFEDPDILFRQSPEYNEMNCPICLEPT